jgi:hypothetical protein
MTKTVEKLPKNVKNDLKSNKHKKMQKNKN